MRFVRSLSIFYLVASSIAKDRDDKDNRRIRERNAAIEADLLAGQKPVHGVRKMSNDEGEKFFMDYWGLSDGYSNPKWLMGNNTIPQLSSFQPPVSARGGGGGRGGALDMTKRDFQCPAGSKSCTAIDRPSSCCGTDETCELVEDTGSGDVGCCAQGQQCSGNIGTCQSGYQACPASMGGGCCFPGYDCVDGGCTFFRRVFSYQGPMLMFAFRRLRFHRDSDYPLNNDEVHGHTYELYRVLEHVNDQQNEYGFYR